MAESRVAPRADEYPIFPEQVPPEETRHGQFTLRFARDREDLDAILRLFDVQVMDPDSYRTFFD